MKNIRKVGIGFYFDMFCFSVSSSIQNDEAGHADKYYVVFNNHTTILVLNPVWMEPPSFIEIF